MKLDIKKMFYLAAIIVTACVIASAAISAITTEPEETQQITPAAHEDQTTYILTEHHGRVTAYIKGVEVPYIETTTAINSLPYDVQEKLKKGIELTSLKELKAIMNEYCS